MATLGQYLGARGWTILPETKPAGVPADKPPHPKWRSKDGQVCEAAQAMHQEWRESVRKLKQQGIENNG